MVKFERTYEFCHIQSYWFYLSSSIWFKQHFKKVFVNHSWMFDHKLYKYIFKEQKERNCSFIPFKSSQYSSKLTLEWFLNSLCSLILCILGISFSISIYWKRIFYSVMNSISYFLISLMFSYYHHSLWFIYRLKITYSVYHIIETKKYDMRCINSFTNLYFLEKGA